MNSGRPAAVLCGDLNMLRCFAGTDVPTLVVCTHWGDLTLHSRYCRQSKVIAPPATRPEQALEDLLKIAGRFDAKPVLFYGDDAMLLLVSRNRRRLAERYRFLLPDEALVEDLVSKNRFADLAARHELPVPMTLLSRQVVGGDDLLRRMPLPCIFKPNSHVGWFTSQIVLEEGGKPRKVLRADTSAEAWRLLAKMQERVKDFVVQQYIGGGDDCIYSFHAYVNARGEALAYHVGRKIRTYPSDSGVSTFLELVHEPRVVDLGLEVLRTLKFSGVAKLDFKRDPASGRFYLLEINPRFNLWNHLGAACGVNLPYTAYRDLCGQACEPQTQWRSGVRWLSLSDDMRAFVRDYRPAGQLTWGRWLRSLCGPKVCDVFSWRDPWPWCVWAWRGAALRARRWLGGRRAAGRVDLPAGASLSARPAGGGVLNGGVKVGAGAGGVPSVTRSSPMSTPISKP